LSSEKVVTVAPEIMVYERGSTNQEELLLLACDGVWDVFSNEDAGRFFTERLKAKGEVCGLGWG
ncbi:unnamed protein product, partial [Discosporangium mesarthrocarpum]